MLQSLLDKYEQGDGEELLGNAVLFPLHFSFHVFLSLSRLALIRKGYLARKPSVELIDGLDFDFINALRSGDENDHDMLTPAIELNVKQERRASTVDVEDLFGQYRSRRSSLDAFALQELLLFDHPGQAGEGLSSLSGHHPHPQEGGGLQPELYADLFQQFAGEELLEGQQTQNVLDLSAYAVHAAQLQRGGGGGEYSHGGEVYGFGLDGVGVDSQSHGHRHHHGSSNNRNNNNRSNDSPSKEYGRGMRHSGTNTTNPLSSTFW